MLETSPRTAPIPDPQLWRELGRQLRVDSIRATTAAGSGHPTSSMSAADLMAVLLCNHLRYDFDAPDNPSNDHLVFSKGHAAPLLYALYKAAGAITDDELMTLRKDGSRLEGHPVPILLPWVDVATGSLGQGLPVGVGVAISGRWLEKRDYKVWVLCGDSEMAEGSVWEALEHASFMRLGNLIAILDMNRLGQRGPTMHQWDGRLFAERARAFGCHALEIDGHDPAQIDRAYAEARAQTDRPTLIVARTVKGSGVEAVADKEGWHGKPLPADMAEAAVKALGGVRSIVVRPMAPPAAGADEGGREQPPTAATDARPALPAFDEPVATRQAYGRALKALGDARPDVVAIDAEVGNSTYTDISTEAHPERAFEMYIAEQQMVATAVGLQVRHWVPFAATFAAFLSRAYDFIRMAAVSRADIRLCGSHAGVSIGEDGPSQMALEDLAMMRAVHGSTVLYPGDGVSAARLTFAMADLPGIVYMRTTREKTPLLYGPQEEFPVGGSKTLRSSEHDEATIVAAGITLHNALEAYGTLQAEGIAVRVVDLYSVKPIDDATLEKAAKETGRIVVVEDHWPEGGMGDAVLSSLASTASTCRVVKLAVRDMPGSATPDQLMEHAGISADHIVDAVRMLRKT